MCGVVMQVMARAVWLNIPAGIAL
jgi:hypothetical protein